MAELTDPFLEVKWGYARGEDGWDDGMNENLVKLAFFQSKRINGSVSSLPASPSNGDAYFLTADQRIYFRANDKWYSSPIPVGTVFTLKTDGSLVKYNGTSTLVATTRVSTVNNKTGEVTLNTDDIGEGGSNLYHTVSRVRAVLLDGLSTATNVVISAGDSILAALGKLQAQINGLKTSKQDTLPHTANTFVRRNTANDGFEVKTPQNVADETKPLMNLNTANWDAAYNWGDHSGAGYLTSVSWGEVTSKPATATRWPAWSEVTSKPSTFPPSSHSHSYLPLSGGQISGDIGVGVAPSTSYRIYATGRSYGIHASGSTMGGRFEDSNGTSTAYCGYGSYGFYSSEGTYVGGGLGVGTTSLPSGGHIRATGNITSYYSDERLKTNLGNVDGALDIISSLNGFRYVNNEIAKSLGYDSDEVQLGVSAQEVKAVLPELVERAPVDIEVVQDENGNDVEVSKSGQEYMTVHYAKLVPVLIEAIKELKEQVDALRGDR